MKKNKYIFIVFLVIVVNIFIMIKNYNLCKVIDKINIENISNKNETSFNYNLENLKSSKYIKNLVSIDLDDSLIIRYEINDFSNIKAISDDVEKSLNIKPSNICVNDDKFLIFEFE